MAAVDAVIRNTPRLCRFITGSAYFAPSHTPFTFTPKMRSKSSSSTSSMSCFHWGTPALAKNTSRALKVARVRSTSAWLSRALVTSTRTARARPPLCSICSAVLLAPASLRSATTTRAPSAAIATAVAAPMPEPPPVTTATRPLSLIVILLPVSAGQLGDRPDRRGVATDHQRGDARRLPLGESFPDPLARTAEGDVVDQGIRDRRLGFGLAPTEIEILDRAGRAFVAVALDQLVVEIPVPGAHAAHVERQPRLHPSPARVDVVADHDADGRHDVEARGRRAAGAEALVEPAAEHLHVPWREERGDPAVGDLAGERDVLGPDGGQVDGQVGPAVQDRAERLAETRRVGAGVGNLVVLAAELEGLLAPEDRPHHRDVLTRPGERPAEGLAVPALHHLGSRDPQTQAKASSRERVERHGRHRRERRRAAGDLHDRSPDVEALRAGGDPGRRRHRVRTVGLGRPHRVITQPLGLLDLAEIEIERGAGVAQMEREIHGPPPGRTASDSGTAVRVRAGAECPRPPDAGVA